MKTILFLGFILISTYLMGQNNDYNKLTEEEKHIIIDKGTEAPFTGKYEKYKADGVYSCKQCGQKLYKSATKFESHCGWPSFDDEIEGAINRIPDPDGRRTEIVCSNCQGHLGHVFIGENYTQKNTRHCVNSVSIDFTPLVIDIKPIDQLEIAYFASGCFWGTQFHFHRQNGVNSTEVGYMGGQIENPSYDEVCSGGTGHAEAIKVVFSPKEVSYRDLAILFFETHDPSQIDRQGPDIGSQYRSAVFYTTEKQKETIEELIGILATKGIKVATVVDKETVFYPAEKYHQDYYQKKGGTPYCHIYQKKF